MSSAALPASRALLGLLLNLVYLFASCFPRDRRLWLFGAWNGRKFIDNPKYVFQHVLESMPAVRPTWITKDRSLAASLRAKGYPAEFAYSLRGLWSQLRAGVVVFTHSVEWDFLAPLVAKRVKRVQTWHGMPIKKIGYDDQYGTPRDRARLVSSLFLYRDDRLDLVIAASQADKEKYETAFNVERSSVVITGYPRNDALLRSMRSANQPPGRQVVYMPTLRGVAGSEFNLFGDTRLDFDAIDARCHALDIEFWIKVHPVQRFRTTDLEHISRCNHIRPLMDGGDVYESIGRFDILVTDFSGIYFDFLISGRPIVMAPLDMEGYLRNDRDLYYDYDELCPDPPCSDWNQVFDRIEILLETKSEPSPRYLALQRRFHAHFDDRAAGRVVSHISRLVGLDGPSPEVMKRIPA